MKSDAELLTIRLMSFPQEGVRRRSIPPQTKLRCASVAERHSTIAADKAHRGNIVLRRHRGSTTYPPAQRSRRLQYSRAVCRSNRSSGRGDTGCERNGCCGINRGHRHVPGNIPAGASAATNRLIARIVSGPGGRTASRLSSSAPAAGYSPAASSSTATLQREHQRVRRRTMGGISRGRPEYHI